MISPTSSCESIAEVERCTETGNLIPFLRDRLGRDIDLSWLDFTRAIDLNETFKDNVLGLKTTDWGIEKSGLCLLVAWTNELIQRRA